jgi:cytochrome c-type biogenesis protein CcmH/NrfG
MLDRRWLLGIVGLAVIAVIATALGLYLTMSARTDPGPAVSGHPAVPKAAATPENTVPPAAVPSIEVAAEKLAQRLRTQDGTTDDWALLARSFVQMRRYAEAVEAYGKALQKTPGDKALLDEQAAARKAAGGK